MVASTVHARGAARGWIRGRFGGVGGCAVGGWRLVDFNRWVYRLVWLVGVVMVGAGVAGCTDVLMGLLSGTIVDNAAIVAVLELLCFFGGTRAIVLDH